MSPKFFKELEIEKEIDINELKGLKINFSTPNHLEIIAPRLPTAETISKILYLIYNKLNYLFDYLDYQIVIQETTAVDKNRIKEYFSFICATPFLWKDKRDLVFFCEQKELLESFTWRRNIVYLPFSDPTTLNHWKPKLISLKKILEKLGLPDIRFAPQPKEKNIAKNDLGNNETNKKEKKNSFNLSHSLSVNNKKNLNKIYLWISYFDLQE